MCLKCQYDRAFWAMFLELCTLKTIGKMAETDPMGTLLLLQVVERQQRGR